MQEETIARDRWNDFLGSFSAENRSWPVTVEVQGQGGVRTIVARSRPLMGVSYQPEDEVRSIRIMLGEEPGGQITRAIIDPSAVILQTDDDGVVAGLKIEAAQATTVLRFEPQSQG